jgi:hypothetical protein
MRGGKNALRTLRSRRCSKRASGAACNRARCARRRCSCSTSSPGRSPATDGRSRRRCNWERHVNRQARCVNRNGRTRSSGLSRRQRSLLRRNLRPDRQPGGRPARCGRSGRTCSTPGLRRTRTRLLRRWWSSGGNHGSVEMLLGRLKICSGIRYARCDLRRCTCSKFSAWIPECSLGRRVPLNRLHTRSSVDIHREVFARTGRTIIAVTMTECVSKAS